MQEAGRNLAIPFEIYRNDGIVIACAAIVVRRDLSAVAGVVEEVLCAGFGHEPVEGGNDVVAVWKERPARVGIPIITHDHLRAGIGRVALIRKELFHVFDILVATLQLVLAADVVDADKKGLFTPSVRIHAHPRIAHGRRRAHTSVVVVAIVRPASFLVVAVAGRASVVVVSIVGAAPVIVVAVVWRPSFLIVAVVPPARFLVVAIVPSVSFIIVAVVAVVSHAIQMRGADFGDVH